MNRTEAIKILRETHDKALFSVRTALETLIPELNESEDEWIREYLVKFVELNKGVNLPPDDADKILAYLEKQQPAEKQDYTDLNDLERAIHRGFLSAGVENVPVTIIKETAKECLAQMKSEELSDEDELMRTTVIQTLERFGGCGTTCMQIAWLKSIRPPLKDREMKLKILKYLSTRCSSIEFEEVENYLNNLRPSWKPSEEQMEALNYAYCELFKKEDVGHNILGPLQKLCDELNKLM